MPCQEDLPFMDDLPNGTRMLEKGELIPDERWIKSRSRHCEWIFHGKRSPQVERSAYNPYWHNMIAVQAEKGEVEW